MPQLVHVRHQLHPVLPSNPDAASVCPANKHQKHLRGLVLRSSLALHLSCWLVSALERNMDVT